MKRSKILDKISCFIHQNRRATEVWTSDDMANCILDIIEELGMLPPDNKTGDKWIYDPVNEWEAEDE